VQIKATLPFVEHFQTRMQGSVKLSFNLG